MGEKRKSLDEFTEKALHYQKVFFFLLNVCGLSGRTTAQDALNRNQAILFDAVLDKNVLGPLAQVNL